MAGDELTKTNPEVFRHQEWTRRNCTKSSQVLYIHSNQTSVSARLLTTPSNLKHLCLIPNAAPQTSHLYNFALIFFPSPLVKYSLTASLAFSTTAASSTVAGTVTSFSKSPATACSRISRSTLRSVLPDRVLGIIPGLAMKPPRLAIGPMLWRRRALRSLSRSGGGEAMATKAKGTWPFMGSGIGTTQASVMAGWPEMACSMAPSARVVSMLFLEPLGMGCNGSGLSVQLHPSVRERAAPSRASCVGTVCWICDGPITTCGQSMS